MDQGGGGAIQGGIEFAPLAGRHRGTDRQAQWLQQHADADRIGGKHLPHQGQGRPATPPAAGGLDRTRLGLGAGIGEHGAGQQVLGLGMGGHAKTRHVQAEDAHALDLARQQPQGHAGGGGHAKIDDHQGVDLVRIGQFKDRRLEILEQLAGDQGLGVEGDIAHRAPRPIEVAGEAEAIDAAGGATEHRGRAPHAQTHPQRAEGRAHGLGLVVGTRCRGVQRLGGRVRHGGVRRAGRGGHGGVTRQVTQDSS